MEMKQLLTYFLFMNIMGMIVMERDGRFVAHDPLFRANFMGPLILEDIVHAQTNHIGKHFIRLSH